MTAEGPQKILVVDDDPDAVEFVRTVMEEAGYEVIPASDGVEGLQRAREESPALAIVDIQMPQKDGFTMFADMRKDEKLKAIPVVMLTGVGERVGIRFSARDMGDYLGEEPEAYIEKPVDPALLQETVNRLLGREVEDEGQGQ